jgi:hypothetical protein
MARTDCYVSGWDIRYKCHCGAILQDDNSFVEVQDSKEAPSEDYICPSCGCYDSYKAEIGRYRWTYTYILYIFRRHCVPVWEPWTGCQPTPEIIEETN